VRPSTPQVGLGDFAGQALRTTDVAAAVFARSMEVVNARLRLPGKLLAASGSLSPDGARLKVTERRRRVAKPYYRVFWRGTPLRGPVLGRCMRFISRGLIRPRSYNFLPFEGRGSVCLLSPPLGTPPLRPALELAISVSRQTNRQFLSYYLRM
jgi:hypothetical protein